MLINIFPTTPKAHYIPIPQNFQLRFNLIFSEKIIQYSSTFAPQVQMSWNQAHAPLLVKNFRHQEHDLKHHGLVDLITTKQNKLLSFVDRCQV